METQAQLVLIRARVHPFPSRTRKLSSLLPTILGWRRPGKIGSANIEETSIWVSLFFCLFCCRVRDEDHPVTGQLSSYLPALFDRRRLEKTGSANTKNTTRKRGVFVFLFYCEGSYPPPRAPPCKGDSCYPRKGLWFFCFVALLK